MSTSTRPAEVFPPGDFLREELDARGWTQREFAEILGRPIQLVNQILTGNKQITPETAVELAAALGTSPELWLGLENAYRLHRVAPRKDVARRAKIAELYPYPEAAKRGWVKDTKDQQKREKEVCRALGIDRLDETPRCRIAARKTDGYDALSVKQLAWVFRCQELAEMISVPVYDIEKLKRYFPRDLIGLTRQRDGLRQVARLLQNAGVRLMIVPTLGGSKIDGAMFWLDKSSPVVALSARLDRVDNLWFTLFHEIVHVLQGYHDRGRLDVDLFQRDENDLPACEKEANAKAADSLIPPGEYRRFSKLSRFTELSIHRAADDIGVHPSIVLGRLQYDKRVEFNSTLTRRIHCKASEFYGFDRTEEILFS